MKNYKEYLLHILEETKFLINELSNLTQEKFMQSEILKRAFVRSLEIIGEAVKQIPQEKKDEFYKIEWKDLARLRDRLIHQYFGIDYEIIWDIVSNEIPNLYEKIDQMISRPD